MNPNPNPFIDFDQLLIQIEETHIAEETPFGECEACLSIYEVYSRDGRAACRKQIPEDHLDQPYLAPIKEHSPVAQGMSQV